MNLPEQTDSMLPEVVDNSTMNLSFDGRVVMSLQQLSGRALKSNRKIREARQMKNSDFLEFSPVTMAKSHF